MNYTAKFSLTVNYSVDKSGDTLDHSINSLIGYFGNPKR